MHGSGSFFYFGDPRFRLIDKQPGELEESLPDEARSLLARHAECPECLDPFALQMSQVIDAQPDVGIATVRTVESVFRNGSAIVERPHLPGQELKPKRSRGVAVDGRTLSEYTFETS